MNDERIPLLAEKAIQEIGGFDIWYMPKPNAFIHKFAELIVRECAQFVEDKFDFIGDEIIVKEKMLEHFGVEE